MRAGNTEFRTQNAEHRMQNAEYRTQNTEHRIENTECRMQNTGGRRAGVHPQTLRMYERLGLLKPSRSDGNTRLYTDRDLERLEIILNLTRDLGVNLAGVEVILNMREKMERMQVELEEIIRYVQQHTTPRGSKTPKDALIPVPGSRIVKIVGKRK
jgi:MerR family transcriptional regulator/heat shock protein HspR